MILNDFDECKTSTFDPNEVLNVIPDFPKVGVTCYSHKLIDKIVEIHKPPIIAYITNANAKVPVYKLNYKGKDIALYMSPVGAPCAVASYEDVLAMGLQKLIMFGTCGVLDSRIDDLAIIIPTSAIRDEGTSYHYMEASDEVTLNPKYKKEFIEVLKAHNCSYIEGKTWTTDAIYRETRKKVLKRKEQGCISVEMESAAMAAVSRFREKDLFVFFYAADNLDAVKWDMRSLGNDDRLSEKEKIIILALELALKIAD